MPWCIEISLTRSDTYMDTDMTLDGVVVTHGQHDASSGALTVTASLPEQLLSITHNTKEYLKNSVVLLDLEKLNIPLLQSQRKE